MIMRRLNHAFFLALLATAAVVADRGARADFNCGDGVVNLGEECDDGNLLAGDCCSAGCQFEQAGTICRNSVDPCDAIEVCAGDSSTCPPDTGILGDSDGDGLCDAMDVCPTVFDPLQTDRDADGIGDACDPCTNVFSKVRTLRLRIRKLDYPLGEQRLKYHAFVTVRSTPSIDPSAKPLRFFVTDSRSQNVLDVTIPPVAFDAATRVGWVKFGNGEKWVFFDGIDQLAGVDNATLRMTPAKEPGAVDVRVVIQSGGNTSAITPVLPIALTLVIDTPLATDGQCAEIGLGEDRCTFRNQSGKVLCH